MKHTKGPWFASSLNPKYGMIGIGTLEDSANIATVHPKPLNPEEAEANAELIAKSPELLVSLQSLLDYVTDRYDPLVSSDPEHPIKKAQELIKKINACDLVKKR